MHTLHTRLRRAKLLVALLLAALLAPLLAACGSQGPARDLNPTVALKDSGKTLDTVQVAFPGSLANLYIGQESGILNYQLAAIVQEGLLSQDTHGQLRPALAKSWTQPNPNTFVFTLRESAKFQNGAPVTPDDVVFSLEKAADAEASPGLASYLGNLGTATVTGAHEVTVTTKEPDPAFLRNLTSAGALVVTQRQFWEKHRGKIGTGASLLLGSGPFRVTEFQPNSHAVLTRVRTWWGGVPKVKRIRVSFIPDPNTRLAAAQRGEVDIALNVPLTQVNSWRQIPGMRVTAQPDLSYAGLLFDQSVRPFDRAEVRRGIAHAIDRTTIAKRLLRGFGEPASTIMTPESIASEYDRAAARKLLASVPQYDYNPKKAKRLLRGHKLGTLELTYPNTGPHLGLAAQAIAANLKAVGVRMTVREVPIEEWLASIGDGKHGVGFMWYFSTTGDPAEVNSYLVGAENPGHAHSPQAEELVASVRGVADPHARIARLVEVETLNSKQATNVPLWWGRSITAFSNRVGITDLSPHTFQTVWAAELFAAEPE